MGIAVGQMGMSPNDFLNLTPAEFQCIYDEWHKRITTEHQLNWERTRYLCFIVAKTVDSKGKINKPSDILKLPWEKQKNEKPAEDMETRKQRMDKLAKFYSQKTHKRLNNN